jgi:acetyl esterase/lipase
MQTQLFKTINGQKIAADIYPLPHQKNGQKHPAILFIHGGGLIMGHRQMIAPNHRPVLVSPFPANPFWPLVYGRKNYQKNL